jgi:hypothetical protein
MLAALALILLQGQPLDLTASVDRPRVAVGEEIVYTLRAIGHSTAPFRVDLPALDGFALVERRERTDMVVGTREPTRAYTLELQLRAEQVGSWQIGPIRIEHGVASAFSPVARVSVVSASAGASSGLEPDLLDLIPRVPAPRVGAPSVFVVTSDHAVFAGDQVNVLTAAWLPRGLRLRLRQPPTLSPPVLPGVWSTPRASVAGALASRVVDGETYDLFVGFQTVYPLNPGTVPIPAARLAWMQPSGRQYFSDEQRQTVESPGLTLDVRSLPIVGRPAAFTGPVARNLRIDYRLGQSAARAGAALPVEVVVSGAGNLPLWPAPAVLWPAGARAYEEGTEGSARLTGLRLGGTKKFRFAVVPDSAGSLALPPLEYSYFDPGDGSYRVARAPGILVPVLDAAPTTDRRTALPIEVPGRLEIAERVVGLRPVVLILLLLTPIGLMLGVAWYRRRPPRRPPPDRTVDPAARLDVLMASLVSPGWRATPHRLAGALRRVGMDRSQAEKLIALHRALETERFGREGTGHATAGLQMEISAVLDAVPARIRRMVGLVAGVCVTAALFATPLRPLLGQSGVELYQRGEFGAAAQAFRGVASAAPSPVYWYNVAAAEYMSHRDAYSVAALLAARARAPRDPRIVMLWNSLAREHEQLRHVGRSWPVTAEECLVTGLALLWLGALLFAVAGRRRMWWGMSLLLAAGSVAAGAALREQRAVPRGILSGGASLRISPHGLAPERGAVPAFSVVRLERSVGGWWLIATPDGAEGWVPADILALTPALD